MDAEGPQKKGRRAVMEQQPFYFSRSKRESDGFAAVRLLS
jgi:hypothetical protein